MSGFYDIFSTQIKEVKKETLPALENEDRIILDNYVDYLYFPDELKIRPGLEEDDPFEGLAPDPEDASIQTDNQPSSDPMSMDNNDLGGNSPFDGLVDESNDMGDMFSDNPDDQSDEQKNENAQIVVDREKLLRAAYNLGDNIRKIFPNRFLQLREIIQSNTNNMQSLELSQTEDQDALRKIILLYEEQIKNIDIFLDIIADQTFDSIFRKYVEIFTNCSKLKDAYNILIEENDKSKKSKKSRRQQ